MSSIGTGVSFTKLNTAYYTMSRVSNLKYIFLNFSMTCQRHSFLQMVVFSKWNMLKRRLRIVGQCRKCDFDFIC